MEPPQIIRPTQTPEPGPAPEPSTPPPVVTDDSGSAYDFILNPQKPAKKPFGDGLFKDPFIAKVVFLVGGTLVVILATWFAVTLFFGNKTDIESLVAIAQRGQEIVRVSNLGDDANSQDIRNAAINTEVSIKSQQNSLIAYLSTQDRKIKANELSLKKDATTEPKLKKAKEAGTFDATYTTIMRAQLTDYASALKSAYNGKPSKTARKLLAQQYNDVQLLLKAWPEEEKKITQ